MPPLSFFAPSRHLPPPGSFHLRLGRAFTRSSISGHTRPSTGLQSLRRHTATIHSRDRVNINDAPDEGRSESEGIPRGAEGSAAAGPLCARGSGGAPEEG
uniref:Uncharacterized protein n=1 Tax=Steinernema glaseri TaxID=37863 RepID=A0A1I7Y710_9BILA